MLERLPAYATKPVPARALWIPLHAVIVAIATAAIVNFHLGIAAKLGLAAVISVSFTCLGIVAHELLHGTIIEALWLRRLLAALCLAPLCIGVSFWTIWHATHHSHTQDPAGDPDTWGPADGIPRDAMMRVLRPFTNARTPLFVLLLCTGVTGHAAALLLGRRLPMNFGQRLLTFAEFLAVVLFWAGVGYWLGWSNFVFFYVIPLLLANGIINSFVVTNHFLNPLSEGEDDPLASSLTVTSFRFCEWLFLNFNYHTEHHLLPGVSPRHAREIRQIIKELWPDRYHEMPHARALLAVWRTPRSYRGRFELFDTSAGLAYGTLGHGLEKHEHANRS